MRARPIGAGGRLSDVIPRYLALAGDRRRRRRYPAELVARRIRRDGGDVWPAVCAFGISYAHACRIRNGWRPDGRRGEPIAYAFSRNVGRRTPSWARQ